MKIRLVKPHDGNSAPMIFVEISHDTWLEINRIPEFDEHAELLERIKKERAQGCFAITYASRAFRIWSTLQENFEIEITRGWD